MIYIFCGNNYIPDFSESECATYILASEYGL